MGVGSQMLLLVVVVVVVLGDCLLLLDDVMAASVRRGGAWSSLRFAFSCAFLPLAAGAGFRVFETPFVVLLAALFAWVLGCRCGTVVVLLLDTDAAVRRAERRRVIIELVAVSV